MKEYSLARYIIVCLLLLCWLIVLCPAWILRVLAVGVVLAYGFEVWQDAKLFAEHDA